MSNTVSDNERDTISDNEIKVSTVVALNNIRHAFTHTYFKTLVFTLICTIPLIVIGYIVGLSSPDNGLTITTSTYALITPIAAIYGFYSINKNLLYRKITKTDWAERYQGEFALVDKPLGIIYRGIIALVFCFLFISIPTGQMVNPDSIFSLMIMSTFHAALFLFVALRFFRAMVLYPPTQKERQEYRNRCRGDDKVPLSAGDIRNTSSPISIGGWEKTH